MGFGQQFAQYAQQFTNPYDQQGSGEDEESYLAKLRKRQLEGTGDKVEQTVQNSPNLPWAPGQDSINITRNSTNIGYGGSSPAGRVSPTTPSFNPGGGGGGYPYGSMIYGRPDDLGGGGGGGTSVNSTWYPGTYGGGGGGGTTVDSSWYPGPYYTGVGGGSPFPDWTEKDWNEYLASMGL